MTTRHKFHNMNPDTSTTRPMEQTTTTHWRRILIALLAGFSVAFQIGKIPASLPSLIADFDLSLFWAGAVVSLFSVIAAAFGLILGGSAARVGFLRGAIAALLISSLGSFLGVFAHTLTALLFTRMLEGLGFILASVTLPSLIASSASQRDRPVALGIWGAFVPGGASIMLLASPGLLGWVQWRGLWLVTSILIALCAILLWQTFRGMTSSTPPAKLSLSSLKRVFRRGPLLMTGCFATYSAQFLAVTAFLPTFLIENYGLSIAVAATLSAIVIASNVVGNFASGWLLRKGMAAPTLLVAAATVMGGTSLILYLPQTSLVLACICALAFSSISGLIPGTLFATAPDQVDKQTQLSAVVGLMLQGVGMGQLLGPLLLTSFVSNFGAWAYAPAFTLPAALLGVAFAAGLRKN